MTRFTRLPFTHVAIEGANLCGRAGAKVALAFMPLEYRYCVECAHLAHNILAFTPNYEYARERF